MTDEQRYAIENLRCKGCGYKKIAIATGLPESTVKSYLRRMKERGEVPVMRPVSFKPVKSAKPAKPARHAKPKEPDILAASVMPAVHPEELPDTTRSSRPCLLCGTPVIQTPGRREKKFCSASCRIQWWNRNKYKAPRKSRQKFICQGCGSPFTAYGVDNRKYCAHACYISARFHKSMQEGLA